MQAPPCEENRSCSGLFFSLQEDDGASDDETDSFKKASEQAYKEHLEEQSRRQVRRFDAARVFRTLNIEKLHVFSGQLRL
jgi:hypothetical protein